MKTNDSKDVQYFDPEQGTVEVIVLEKATVQDALARLFIALEEATGNGLTAVDIITKIADGIEADPEFSKQILTPENISKAYALKAKSDLGTITLNDIENAFPVIAQKVPFWFMLKQFKF